ncbi:hypothetical protein MIT9_P0345 [Methylomarinovum caldicuralii]|uniref:DUF2780 domain-containing protein n=1 Tax=Methylomarinovum caldicuralii TaxID=438856 RepID=A0AAU9C119_9GAMM|nr:DUF2780 domain-containing protein [Methylomarinovum caldicuralii]BCX80769.1 hypothetical protein MIT9_P0345 [Methylomarinovum caldicuralii]
MSLAVGCAGQGGNSGAAAAAGVNGWGNAVQSAANVSQASGRSGAALRTAGSLAGHPLVQQLTRQLGDAPEQAAGGAGLLFQTARQRMAPEQFKALEHSVPGVDRLMAAAPQTGGLSSLMGGAGSTVNQAANLIQGFRQLNLSSDMVNQFIPVVVNYVKETGGNALASALQAALVGG